SGQGYEPPLPGVGVFLISIRTMVVGSLISYCTAPPLVCGPALGTRGFEFGTSNVIELVPFPASSSSRRSTVELDDPGGIAEGVVTHVPALRVPPLAAMSAAPASLVKCVTVVTLLDWSKAPGTSPISAASPIPAVPTATAATPRPTPIARSVDWRGLPTILSRVTWVGRRAGWTP